MLAFSSAQEHYESLNDDALAEALSVGPRGYEPGAWRVLTLVARKRGLRYVGPDVSELATGAAAERSRASSQRVPRDDIKHEASSLLLSSRGARRRGDPVADERKGGL